MPYFLSVLAAAAQIATVPASTPLIHPGDKIALCGDSITEQRQYSRIIETYLRACQPDLNVEFRQYGWSGETWDGFLARMDQDVLRFKPTLSLTLYGMNDHRYVAYDPAIVTAYIKNMENGIVKFQRAGSRVVICSPNSIGKIPPWAGKATVAQMNDHLTKMSRACMITAARNQVNFIDNNAVMNRAARKGKKWFGSDYTLEGSDGVHPNWAGHMVMAYAVLKGLGVSGDLGTITVNLRGEGHALASGGHKVVSVHKGTITLMSSRYPFYIPREDVRSNQTLASGAALVPFQRDLNRFTLVLKHPKKSLYRVAWGASAHIFTAAQLEHGINLPVEFSVNPLTQPFMEIDHAVAAKQSFETTEVKNLFRTDSTADGLRGVTKDAEAIRDQLVFAIKKRQTPITHTITITFFR